MGYITKILEKYTDAYLIREIRDLETMNAIDAGDAGSVIGTGGMQTKLSAARLLEGANKTMFIVNSGVPNVLNEMASGQVHGTFFDFRK